MRLFFDNCTSPVLAATLDGFLAHQAHSATHIRDLPCGRHAPDLVWIEFLKSTGDEWLVVTGDGRLYKNRSERLAFGQANLRGLVLAPAFLKTPVNQQAALLIWRWPDLQSLLRLDAPFLYELPISRSTKLRLLRL